MVKFSLDVLKKAYNNLFNPEPIYLGDWSNVDKNTGEKVTPTPTATPTPEQHKEVVKMAKEITKGIKGFRSKQPNEELANLIETAASTYKVEPAVLAAILYQESRFNPTAENVGSGDLGIAQINLAQHPVSKEQALDPNFAVKYAARYLGNSQNKFGDINRAIASYNVGRGGASVQGPEPYGGGPKGQTYINNVARNLDLDTIKRLGLKVSPSLLQEYQ